MCAGVVLVGDVTFKGLPQEDLLLALVAVPFLLALTNIQSVYQGFRSFREFNAITLAQASLPLLLIGIAIILGGEVRAAIAATVAAAVLLFAAVVAYVWRSTRIAWRVDLPFVRGSRRTACALIRRTSLPTLATDSTSSWSTVSRAPQPSVSTAQAS